MKYLRMVFATIIAVSVAVSYADAASAAEAQAIDQFIQRAIQYDRSLFLPQASPEQHHLLAVSIAANETGITDPDAHMLAYNELASMVTYLVQSDTDFFWDGVGWTASERTTYTWSGTKLMEQVAEEYKFDLEAWRNSTRLVNTYDGNGRLSTSTYQDWDSLGSTWVNQSLTTSTYDGSGNLSNQLTQNWSGGQWVNYSNTTFTYSGSQVATAITQQWSGSAWSNISKLIYTYNGSLLTEILWQGYAGSNWVDTERFLYSYDGSNRLTMTVWERWGTSGPWAGYWKWEYSYDGSTTNETLEVFYEWDTAGQTWYKSRADTSRYSGGNLSELVTYYFAFGGSLSRALYSYDLSDNRIEFIYQTGFGGFYMNSSRTVYVYIVAGVFDDDGLSGTTPADFSIGQNYPNPFNLSTFIPYTLDHDTHVRIAVSNILGQTVKTLVDSYQFAGRHQTAWDGRDQNGRDVASGIYFFRVQVGQASQTRKMVLLK